MPYLADRLEDPELSVQISAVTAIQKISMINPRLFLVTIPKLFQMMSTKSNWLLIRLVKLLCEMSKVEKRLMPKLTAKFKEMLQNPLAKSVEYEIIRQTFATELNEDAELFELARQTLLQQFLIVPDPNLTFLGLEALVALMEQRKLRKQAVEIYSSERQAVVNLFNSNDQCIQ